MPKTILVIDDEAGTSIANGKAPFAGAFRPEGSLSLVDGATVNGQWTLEITDDTKRNVGSLSSWSLVITSAATVAQSATFDPSAVLTASGDAASVFYMDEVLPAYFEIQATINAGKPLAGAKSNAYLVFDYQSETDFKFAGVNISTNKGVLDDLRLGNQTPTGFVISKQVRKFFLGQVVFQLGFCGFNLPSSFQRPVF